MSVLHMYKLMCALCTREYLPVEKHQSSESIDPGFFGFQFYMFSVF